MTRYSFDAGDLIETVEPFPWALVSFGDVLGEEVERSYDGTYGASLGVHPRAVLEKLS